MCCSRYLVAFLRIPIRRLGFLCFFAATPGMGQTFSFTGGGGAIADNAATIFTLNMTGDLVIESLRLDVTHLTHGSPSDLDIILVSPRGESIRIMSDRGSSSGVTDVDLTFLDGAPGVLDDVAAVVSGSYKPDGLVTGADSGFATFEGQPGCCDAWVLIVIDDMLNGSAGQLESFTLSGGTGAVTLVPAVSEWGLAMMTLLIFTSGTLLLRRRALVGSLA